MCPKCVYIFRKITYGELSEFVQEKKITYKVYISLSNPAFKVVKKYWQFEKRKELR